MARSLTALEEMKARDVTTLMSDVSELKRQMAENTVVTVQVRDILASFRIVGKVAKWTTAVVTACAVVWGAIKGVRA
jgi:hypothetical protein